MKKFLSNPSAFPILLAAFFCIALYITGIYCRPIFPVDETRYMTVAWEMVARHDFILPHLNGAPYDHKPPLLFWSINLLWMIFGISQQAGMAVPFFYAFAFIMLTHRLAQKLRPDDINFAPVSVAILAGSVPFIIYSNMIMFDLMLGVFSLLGLTAVWDFAKTGKARHLGIFTLAIGLGALAKGPAILLHTLFPIVFVRYWNKGGIKISRTKWALGFLAAVIGGTLIGLTWAIPAAIKGGPEFANKIFWGQTAGRVTNSFDHKHPIWWFLPFVPLLLMPWVFSLRFWKGASHLREMLQRPEIRFLTIWALPVFASFSLISGKQIHYLVPIVPAISMFIAACLIRQKENRILVGPFIAAALLILAPVVAFYIAPHFQHIENNPLNALILQGLHPTSSLILFMLATLGYLLARGKSLQVQVTAIAVATLLFMVSFQISSKDGFFKTYDLRPVAEVLQKNPQAPIAFVRNYHGEWGYLARLTDRTVTQIDLPDLKSWFRNHPDGIVTLRTGNPDEFASYDVIYTMPYKSDNTYAVIVKKGHAPNFKK